MFFKSDGTYSYQWILKSYSAYTSLHWISFSAESCVQLQGNRERSVARTSPPAFTHERVCSPGAFVKNLLNWFKWDVNDSNRENTRTPRFLFLYIYFSIIRHSYITRINCFKQLWIFIALKSPSHWNPQTLRLMSSTLTSTPPRSTTCMLITGVLCLTRDTIWLQNRIFLLMTFLYFKNIFRLSSMRFFGICALRLLAINDLFSAAVSTLSKKNDSWNSVHKIT
jgi:hypothetical protein